MAARSPQVAFIVLWAGPGLGLPAVVLQQTQDLLRAEGAPPDQIARETALDQLAIGALCTAGGACDLAAALRTAIEALPADQRREIGDVTDWVDAKVKEIDKPWFRWYLDYDPAVTLAKVACPGPRGARRDNTLDRAAQRARRARCAAPAVMVGDR